LEKGEAEGFALIPLAEIPPAPPEAVKKFRQREIGGPGNKTGFSLPPFEFFQSFPLQRGEIPFTDKL
jgi:hypothetical protein